VIAVQQITFAYYSIDPPLTIGIYIDIHKPHDAAWNSPPPYVSGAPGFFG
jgi:hypothetical protein